uniref:Uncharacterized protein n=1 Tax=Cannabis sativa TaxID=3483 RepID=A0A803P4J4_CANSA
MTKHQEDPKFIAHEDMEKSCQVQFKEDFELSSNPVGNLPQPDRYHFNPNILRDHEVVKSKGTFNSREVVNEEHVQETQGIAACVTP